MIQSIQVIGADTGGDLSGNKCIKSYSAETEGEKGDKKVNLCEKKL